MYSTTLTVKQSRFVSEYLVDGNGAAAAIRAGYGVAGGKVTACRLLTNPNVQKALQARQAADATRLSLQREDVLAGLQEAINQAREQGNPAAMIRGWSEIGKMLGLMAPETKRVELSTGQRELQANFSAMNDAQLLALIAQASV